MFRDLIFSFLGSEATGKQSRSESNTGTYGGVVYFGGLMHKNSNVFDCCSIYSIETLD